MKKILIFLNCFLILCFSIYFFNNCNKASGVKTDGILVTQKIDDDLIKLNSYQGKDKIYLNNIPHYNNIVAKAQIKSYELPCFSSSIKAGDIYLKNQIIEGYRIPYDLRVIKKMDKAILADNLETTYASFSFLPKFKYINKDNFKFVIKHLETEINMENYEFTFNKDIGLYTVTLKLTNNGRILNSANIRIDFTYYEEQEGLFIDKSYLYQDNIGNFINKYMSINGENYYKKVYVEILKKSNNYYKISGKVNGNNIIIKF